MTALNAVADYDGDDRTPPNDPHAEASVLGGCLSSGRIPDEVADLLGKHFYRPANETLWETMRRLTREGKPCDIVSVRAAIAEQGPAKVRETGGDQYLLSLLHAAPAVPETAAYHADIIRDRYVLRKVIETAGRVQNDAYRLIDEAETVRAHAEREFAVIDSGKVDDVSSLLNIDEFTSLPVNQEDWVIPDLLARGERLVLTGSEGLGKTTLIRQFAVCAAAGIAPFSGRAARPMTCLAIDVENPVGIMVRRWQELVQASRAHGYPVKPERLWIDRRPGGMDLADPADLRWLKMRLQATNPDLLVIGPAYKLYIGGGGEREEDLARRVTSALDLLREEFHFALIVEHHSPKGQSGGGPRTVAPIGSSLWMRWPEFGYGIRWNNDVSPEESKRRRLVDFDGWRGDRDERPWPEHLESLGGGMPWVEAFVQ